MKTPFANFFRAFWSVASFLVIIFWACQKRPAPQSYFPETGAEAVHQISLDMQSNVRVLALALRPGYEDLAGLAYLRLARGATIKSAYVSNGEAGESDTGLLYPHQLAGSLRLEASAALKYLDGEAYFLNLPDLVAARDSLTVRQSWPSDSLRARLKQLILTCKPDVIIVARDLQATVRSLQTQVLLTDLFAAVRELQPQLTNGHAAETNSDTLWQISRIFVDEADKPGLRLPVEDKHPEFGKKYREIAEEAGAKYSSLYRRRPMWQMGKSPSYSQVYPTSGTAPQALTEGSPEAARLKYLRGMATSLARLGSEAEKKSTKELTPAMLNAIDSVSIHIAMRHRISSLEERLLYDWKMNLDRLRNALLGVHVDFSISDTTMTVVQVAFLDIKNITGLSAEGETTIMFDALPKDWVVNESLERRFTYKPGDRYTLLSPQQLEFNTPHGLHGLNASQAVSLLKFHVVHRNPKRELSFIKPLELRMYYAPRFLVEVTTPIVRAIPGEKVVLRMKNYSRDGVADTIRVAHEAVTSTTARFRLSNKEAEQLVTLYLDWPKEVEEGTHIFPIDIAGEEVAQFAARKFSTAIDRDKRIGVLVPANNHLLQDALQRLTVRSANVVVNPQSQEQLDSLNVVLVDRRAPALEKEASKLTSKLRDFARNGGHVIVLAQEASTWNANPIWEGLQLSASQRYDAAFPLQYDGEHALLKTPNALTEQDWDGWLYQRGYNVVALAQSDGVEMPVRAADTGAPLLLSHKLGRGRITYVDLALTPQLINIHPGAYRLLANLVSY